MFGYYVLGGIIATLIDFLVLYGLYDIVHLHLLLSQLLSFCVALVFSLMFHKYITFQDKSTLSRLVFSRFCIVQGIGIGLGTLIFDYMMEVYAVLIIAFIVSRGCITVITFILHRHITFRVYK